MIREIRVKQALVKSGISGIAYSLNPYIGCAHGCIYCYADFIGRWRNVLPWGEIIEVKVNLLARLREELKRKKLGEICLGTVCDPYQPIEEKYQLTREAIKLLKDFRFPFTILTKSSLCLRDIDLLAGQKIPGEISVEMTLTTLDERIRKIFEPNSPAIEERIKTLKELKRAGIKTTLFFGPVLPYFSDKEEEIKEVFRLGEALGVEEILVDRLNYIERKLPKIITAIQNYPAAIHFYEQIRQNYNRYTKILKERVKKVAEEFSIPIRVIF